MEVNYSEINNYDRWANKKILDAITQSLNKETLNFQFHHILEANRIWYYRFTMNPTDWDDRIDELDFESRIEENFLRFDEFIMKRASSLNDKVEIVNLKGEKFIHSIEECLHHLFNHGTHHRAQIQSILKQQNLARPSIDFITYARGV